MAGGGSSSLTQSNLLERQAIERRRFAFNHHCKREEGGETKPLTPAASRLVAGRRSCEGGVGGAEGESGERREKEKKKKKKEKKRKERFSVSENVFSTIYTRPKSETYVLYVVTFSYELQIQRATCLRTRFNVL